MTGLVPERFENDAMKLYSIECFSEEKCVNSVIITSYVPRKYAEMKLRNVYIHVHHLLYRFNYKSIKVS